MPRVRSEFLADSRPPEYTYVMRHQSPLSQRQFGIDVIRVLAMLMVVALHTILNFTLRPDFFGTKAWFIIEPIVALSAASVPLFFMLSGYLTLDRERTIAQNWQKLSARLLVPLLFFEMLTGLVEFVRYQQGGAQGLSFFQSQLVRLTNFPSSPLWFLEVLVFLYLLNPVWQRIFARDKGPALARYVTLLALIFTVATGMCKFPSLKAGTFFTTCTGWLAYTFYYLYGGLIKQGWDKKPSLKQSSLLVLVGLLITMAGDYFTLYMQVHSREFVGSGYFGDFTSAPVLMMAVGIFYLCSDGRLDRAFTQSSSIVTRAASRAIQQLAALSYGIYLIHPFIVTALHELKFDFNTVSMNIYLFNFLNYGLVFGVSALLAAVLRQTPGVRKVVGEG